MTTISRAGLPSEPVSLLGRGGRRASAGALVIAAVFGLASCGGGDSSSPVPGPAPAPAPPAPGPAPGPGPAPAPAPNGPPLVSNSCEPLPSPLGASEPRRLAATSPSGRSLTYSLVSDAKSGTVQLNSNGEFTYTRTAAARGDMDSFVYKVTDSAGLSAQATAQVIYGARRIMPLGDSITDGVETYTEPEGAGPVASQRVGYRKVLLERLVAEGYAVDFVGSLNSGSAAGLADEDHEGRSGATQSAVRSGIFSWLDQNRADVVLLHIGTNDIPGDASATPTAAATSSILSTVNTWTATTTNPPVQLLLAKIIGQRSNTPEVGEFNNNLQSLYDSHWADPSGSRPRFVVDLVDMNSKLNTTTDLTPLEQDTVGLHPNQTGYTKMANAWFEFLVQNQAIHKCP